MPEPRRIFGPVVLLGVAAAGLLAAAGAKPWVSVDGSTSTADRVYLDLVSISSSELELPLAAALALVLLATWGVLLVTRGAVRRVLAGLGALAAVGLLACVLVAFVTLPDNVREAFQDGGADRPEVSFTGWFWTAAVSALVSFLAALTALRHVRDWPEMGSRYDAPGVGETPSGPLEEQSNLDLWKSLDEGHDPTE